jgi:hypothetical protein
MHTIARGPWGSPSLLDSFPYCIYARHSQGRLYPIPWESKWEVVRPFHERRKANTRKLQGDRRYRSEAVCQPIQAFQKARQCQRRNPNRWQEKRNPLRCEICHTVFPDRESAWAHLPCRVNERRVREGFVDFLERLRAVYRERRGISAIEAGELRKIVLASLSPEAYKNARQQRYFSPNSRLTDAENLRRFRTEWLAALLSHTRPGLFDPRLLSLSEWGTVRDVAERFLSAGEDGQRTIIPRLLDPDIPWRRIANIRGLSRKSDVGTEAAVRATLHLHGLDLAKELDRLRLPVKDYENWEALFNRNRKAFDNRVCRLRGKYHLNPVFPAPSSC